jgi:hypothetical protein
MRVEPVTAEAESPERFVQAETGPACDSRYWCLSMPSPLQTAALNEMQGLRSAVADFVARCRAEDVPPDAVVRRFEAFLAAYSSGRESSRLAQP